MPAGETNIKVAVRVRPYNRRELELNQRCIIKVLDNKTLLFDPEEEDDEFFFQGMKQNHRDITKRVNKKLSMDFDRVFDTNSHSVEIFEECTAPLVDAVLDGYNCSVFVYGATGAGKTFTMLGSENSPGLTFLTMRDLFDKMAVQSKQCKFDVGVSYLEVYNEHVMNLLTKSGPLKLREDSNGVVVSGLVLKPIYSAEELLQLLRLGNSNRTQHPTDANAESSRSHAVFQVHIRMTDLKTTTKRTVKLSMIDLAGSERAASTKGIGVRFKEGASINKSLLALGNCINKLADGLKHIPYRDSNLTRLLKDSLGGNCQTLMVANVSLSSLTYEDTYNTLKYASRAKKIRTTLRQNVLKSNMPKDFYVKKVDELRMENDQLKENQKALEAKFLMQQKRVHDDHEIKAWYARIDAVYDGLVKTQEHVIGMQSRVKRLDFSAKMKEEAETFKRILVLNESGVHEDIARFTASITRFKKNVEKQREELQRWRKKLVGAFQDVDNVRREAKHSRYADILQVYQHAKDLEVENAKQRICNKHISDINSEFIMHSHKMRQMLIMSSELLQKSYTHLSDHRRLSPELEKSYEHLQQMMRSNGVKFRDSGKDSDEEHEDLHHLSTGMDEDDDEADAIGQRKKRFRHDIDLGFDMKVLPASATDSDSAEDCPTPQFATPSIIVEDTVFKMPTASAKRNPNETVVFGASENDSDCSGINEFGSKTIILSDHKFNHNKNKLGSNPNSNSARKRLVNNILSDQLVRPPINKDQLKNVLIKSKTFNHQGLLKTVAAGVQKENKKFSPNRIRKSPRATVTKAINSTANFVRKQARAIKEASGGEPVVRINRAASFRARK